MTKRDLVAEILDVVTEVAAVDAAVQQRIEQTIRSRFGGERLPIYSERPLGHDELMARINRGLRERKSVDEIASEVGRHLSSLYRHMNKSCTARKQ